MSSQIELPRLANTRARAGRERDTACYRPRQLSVLVFEPAADDFALIDHALRRMPWFEVQVTLAGTVQAARFALRSADFDVAFVASDDDSADGLDLARALVTNPAMPPAVLISKQFDTETEYDAIGFGVAACIGKDEMTPRVLENYIRQAIWQRAAAQQVVAVPTTQSSPQVRDVGAAKVVAFTRPYAAPSAGHVTFDFQDLVVEHVSDPRYGIALTRCRLVARPLIVQGDRTLLGRVVATALEHAGDGVTAIRMTAATGMAVLEVDLVGLSTAFGDRLAHMQAVVVRAHGGAIEHQLLGRHGSRLRMVLPLHPGVDS